MDVEAHNGNTYLTFKNSNLKLEHSFLFEPNPNSFELLKNKVKITSGDVSTFNIAISDHAGKVIMEDKDTMSKVIEYDWSDSVPSDCDLFFKTNCEPLDNYYHAFKNNTTILKLDVEGHESEVLEGAKKILKEQLADIIYIEVGFDKKNKQQTYYREIEDTLNKYQYYLFRIYEQKNEWIKNSILLRRANFAFVSKKFSDVTPYRKT
ncbi:MAG: FkbM family methyltransferase [Thiopseudomonas sp.]|nr:FkbM family methyltransferase [Thiopseudomonas sp.]MCK9464978.1 FkbM family methyltransferase [Thiopseudomonas sp.]